MAIHSDLFSTFRISKARYSKKKSDRPRGTILMKLDKASQRRGSHARRTAAREALTAHSRRRHLPAFAVPAKKANFRF